MEVHYDSDFDTIHSQMQKTSQALGAKLAPQKLYLEPKQRAKHASPLYIQSDHKILDVFPKALTWIPTPLLTQ